MAGEISELDEDAVDDEAVNDEAVDDEAVEDVGELNIRLSAFRFVLFFACMK